MEHGRTEVLFSQVRGGGSGLACSVREKCACCVVRTGHSDGARPVN
ncbi:hypothetical protein GZL_03086 [Streptomyces sp. 769]|nr:hypothetical protein GZL_03086 [Streptomyces sp. 769]